MISIIGWMDDRTGKIRHGQPVDHCELVRVGGLYQIVTVFKSSPPKDDEDMDARELAHTTDLMTAIQLQDYIRSNP